jgi:hypothetical protein
MLPAKTKGEMGNTGHAGTEQAHDAQIPSGGATLEGELSVPVGASGGVVSLRARFGVEPPQFAQPVCRAHHTRGLSG